MLSDLDIEKFYTYDVLVWTTDGWVIMGAFVHFDKASMWLYWEPEYGNVVPHEAVIPRDEVERVEAVDPYWRTCPRCEAAPGQRCYTSTGNVAQFPHSSRRPPFRWRDQAVPLSSGGLVPA